MTLQKLRYMIEIVDTGTISGAAKKLFVSQPSLSSAIRELEEELGFQIFLRNNRGIILSNKGSEFLGYARQVVEQADLLEHRFLNAKPPKQYFSVSTQHYAFVVRAFVKWVKEYGQEEYEFSFRDGRTHEILENVRDLKSEIGVIYLNEFNQKVLGNLLHEYQLEFHLLFESKPHIFICANHPLANREFVGLEDLDRYPRLSYEQGEYNSFYFSEEILSVLPHKQSIQVSDRATIFNLMIGLNGYTISTGILNEELNGSGIVAIPLHVEETISVGWISNKKAKLSHLSETFITLLMEEVQDITP